MHKHNISALTALKSLVAMGDEYAWMSRYDSRFFVDMMDVAKAKGEIFRVFKKGLLCASKSLHICIPSCIFL